MSSEWAGEVLQAALNKVTDWVQAANRMHQQWAIDLADRRAKKQESEKSLRESEFEANLRWMIEYLEKGGGFMILSIQTAPIAWPYTQSGR